jgi:hypothetical protein
MSADLLRTIRGGGPQARAAATSLLDAAERGSLKPNEAAEAKRLLARPELSDVFSGGLGNKLDAALTGNATPPRDVKALSPNLQGHLNPEALPLRFASDVLLMKNQLVDPRLSASDNAERLMDFFAGYAEHFINLAERLVPDAPVQPMTPDAKAKALHQFERALSDTGFREIRDRASGLDGLTIAKHLLDSKTGDEVKSKARELSLDAPGWEQKHNPNAASSVAVSPLVEPQTRNLVRDDEEAKRPRRGKLGPNLLWNVLHLFRDGEDVDASEEGMKRLVVAAALLLVFIAVVATVFLLTL